MPQMIWMAFSFYEDHLVLCGSNINTKQIWVFICRLARCTFVTCIAGSLGRTMCMSKGETNGNILGLNHEFEKTRRRSMKRAPLSGLAWVQRNDQAPHPPHRRHAMLFLKADHFCEMPRVSTKQTYVMEIQQIQQRWYQTVSVEHSICRIYEN